MAEMKKITRAGMEKLEKDLEYRVAVLRNEIAKEIEFARSYGDLSENAEYTEAKNKQSENETAIARLEDEISQSVVVDDDEVDTGKVSVGTHVRLMTADGREKVYDIVGTREAAPLSGKISDESPVGKALLNHGAGDRVEVELPSGKTAVYEILEIDRI
ncbi:MAG: transcription elongation factor GreA [Clostridia bacterium]|nr:transcription elongation factor GreA [Clostridia bacterium]